MAKKILIIDDEVDVMTMLVYRLKAKGYEVLTTTSGKSGVGLTKLEKPDLILLDYRLPDLSGCLVAEELKKDEEVKNIPIILITASVDNISEKAKECHAVDFIAKPITPEELCSKVHKQIGEA